MEFQIEALPYAPFEALFEMNEQALRERRAVREVATHAPGFPCRVSLQDAGVGEEVVLVHHTHRPGESPFHASHAVYVRRGATQASPQRNMVPAMLRSRVLSLRGFDERGMMRGAELVQGTELEAAIEKMFATEAVRSIDLHNAAAGCYLARVKR